MIGSTIRSANRNESTPAKLIPPDHRTAASGTLPTEQTKLSAAINGPTTTFSSVGIGRGACATNSEVKNESLNCAATPASRKPAVISFHTISQS
jgi:hypothetical protein